MCCQARLKRAEARETGAFKKHTKLQADITAVEVRTATPARPQHSAAALRLLTLCCLLVVLVSGCSVVCVAERRWRCGVQEVLEKRKQDEDM